MAYRAPSKLTAAGSELERALLAELRRVQDALVDAPGNVRDPRGTVPARPQPGEFVRVSAGQPVILPHPRTSRGQSVYVLAEGPATITAMSGLVNGAASMDVGAAGLVVAVSSGDGWSTTGGDVSLDQLPDMAQARVLLREDGAGTGPPTAGTAEDVLDMLTGGTTVGAIPMHGAFFWSAVAPGATAGRPLATNGTGSVPSYQQLDSAGINMAATYPWTGNHSYAGRAALTGVFTTNLAAATNNLAIGNVQVVLISLTGPQNLSGIVPATAGQLVYLWNADTADVLTLLHNSGLSSAGNRLLCPGSVNLAIPNRMGVVMWNDPSSGFWYVQ